MIKYEEAYEKLENYEPKNELNIDHFLAIMIKAGLVEPKKTTSLEKARQLWEKSTI